MACAGRPRAVEASDGLDATAPAASNSPALNNEAVKIKVLQDSIEIIPSLVHRDFGGEIPSYTIRNKEFSIILPDIGNVLVSASTRGFFWNLFTDETMLDFSCTDDYPYFAEEVICFDPKGFDGHNTAYNNQLYVGYAADLTVPLLYPSTLTILKGMI
jgi:hypothetical protein